jgi:hypothetical protein
VHVVIGKANDVLWAQDNLVSVLAPRGLIPLPGARSDLIVCAQSQQGARLASEAISNIDNVTHTMEGGSSELVSRVRELLNDKDGNDRFDARGMPPWADVSLEVPWQFACPEY